MVGHAQHASHLIPKEILAWYLQAPSPSYFTVPLAKVSAQPKSCAKDTYLMHTHASTHRTHERTHERTHARTHA